MDCLHHGKIVWASFTDPQGKDSGDHPAVVVTKADEIKAGQPVHVVVISTKLHYTTAENQVLIPFLSSINGHPYTKLRERCAAICNWLATIEEKNVRKYGGIVKGREMAAILGRLDELGRQSASG